MWYTVKNIYEHTISIVKKKKKTYSVYSGIAISVSKKNMYATKNRYELWFFFISYVMIILCYMMVYE